MPHPLLANHHLLPVSGRGLGCGRIPEYRLLMDQLVPASYLQLEDTVRNIALAMRAKRKPPVLTYKELRWVMVRCWAGHHVLHVSLLPSSTVILPLHTTVMLPLHTTVMSPSTPLSCSPSTPLSHRPSSTPSTFAGIGFLPTLAESSKAYQTHAKDSDYNIQSSISHAKNGLYGKACQVLNSSGIAPNNDSTWQLLKSKHPNAPPPVIPPCDTSENPPILPPDFNILSVLRSFPKATACGPSGL